MIDFLKLVGHKGIILNPTKFQFAQKEIDFAGFHIAQEDVKPLDKYLETIRTFPQPKNVSDIRTWFGLVNQVSHYSKLTDLMKPFKPFLSPKTPFLWTEELEHAFEQSKIELIKAIEHGVRIFDPLRKTCLTPDWSKTGVGYIGFIRNIVHTHQIHLTVVTLVGESHLQDPVSSRMLSNAMHHLKVKPWLLHGH